MGHGVSPEILGQILWAQAQQRGREQATQARQHLCRALRMGVELGSCLPLMHGLPGIALLLADEGQHERAVEVHRWSPLYN